MNEKREKKRFLLCNPLNVQRAVKYILENRKTEVVFRSSLLGGKFSAEVDLSKLILMVNNNGGDLPVEIPTVKGELISSDWVEDIFIQ